jgi:hypothetical protein
LLDLFSGHNNVSRQTSSEDKENYSSPQSGDDPDCAKEVLGKNEKISVKERTKTFNRMASEVIADKTRFDCLNKKYFFCTQNDLA